MSLLWVSLEIQCKDELLVIVGLKFFMYDICRLINLNEDEPRSSGETLLCAAPPR